MDRPNTSTSSKELLHRRGEYLALRAGYDGFYLCQSLQHVYTTTERFKLMWLSERANQKDTYALDYIDHSESACIITQVRLSKVAKDTYTLPQNQKEKVKRELQQALNPSDSDEGEEDEESEPEEDSDDEVSGEPRAKRARKAPAKKTKKAPAKPQPKPRVKTAASARTAKAKGAKQKVVAKKTKKPAPKKAPKPKKKTAKEPKPDIYNGAPRPLVMVL